MLITSCPRCEEKVLVPAGASEDAKVQCPLCSAEYSLGEALQDLPPALVLLDPPAPALDFEAAEEDSNTAAGLASFGLDDTDEFESAEDSDFTTSADPTVTEEPSFSFDDDKGSSDDEGEGFTMSDPEDISSAPSSFDFGGGGGAGTATASTVSTTPTRSTKKKKKKSPVKMMVEVMLGGVAAILAVQAILWWFPWWIPNDKRDPFDLAAKLPSYVAFIAPASLRGEADPNATEDNAPTGPVDGAGVDIPPASNGFGEFDDKFGTSSPEDGAMLDDHGHDHSHDDEHAHDEELAGTDPLRENFGPGSFESEDPLGDDGLGVPGFDPLEEGDLLSDDGEGGDPGEGLEIDPLDGELNDELNDGEFNDGEDDELADVDLLDDDLNDNGDIGDGGEASEPAGVPEFVQVATVDDLETAIADAEMAIAARLDADAASGADLREIAKAYYTSLSHLGEVLSGVPPTAAHSEGGTENVSEILSRLGKSEKEFEFFGQIASGWLNPDRRSNSGVVLAGQVIAIEPAGPYYATQVQLSGGSDKIIEVLSMGDPAGMLAGGYGEGARVVVVGTVIETPASNVPEYAGTAEKIVWTSAAVEIPASEDE